MEKIKGFTFIELMVAVCIVAIITAVAIPSYMASVRKSHRADAKVNLNDIAVRMQRCFTSNSTFIGSPDYTCAVSDKLKTTDGVQSTYYKITVDNGMTATSYKLTAVPLTGSPQQKDIDCQSFTLDQSGKKQAFGGNPSGDTTDKCW